MIFKTTTGPNFKWIVIHINTRVFGFLVSDFAEALKLFGDLGHESSEITHVDISNMRVDGVKVD